MKDMKWFEIALEELIVTRKGKKPLKMFPKLLPGTFPYLDIETIETGIVNQYADSFSTVISSQDDIFIVADGSRSGLVAKGMHGAVGSTILCLTPVLINKDFLFYFLKSKYNYLNGNTTGSSIPHLNVKLFNRLQVPFPPLADQKRIVKDLEQNIESNFAGFKNIESELDRLNQSRQAILEEAVTGLLTTSWRKSNNKFDMSAWQIQSIGEISNFIGSGTTPKGGSANYHSNGITFLRSQNIYPNELRLDNVAFISKELHEEMSRTHVKAGDVLLNITGASIGRAAVVPESLGDANVNQHVCIIRVNSDIDPEFLCTYLNSPVGQRMIWEFQTGVTREGLNYTQIRTMKIHCPPFEEQKAIVQLIKQNISDLDTLASEHLRTMEKLNTLQQSVLETAFDRKNNASNSDVNLPHNFTSVLAEEKKKIIEARKADLKQNSKIKSEMKQKAKEKSNLDIVGVLAISGKRMPAKDVWIASKYQNSIDAFYDDLRTQIKNGAVLSEMTSDEIPQSMLYLKSIQ